MASDPKARKSAIRVSEEHAKGTGSQFTDNAAHTPLQLPVSGLQSAQPESRKQEERATNSNLSIQRKNQLAYKNLIANLSNSNQSSHLKNRQ